ncbi:MAG: T9SS type A sorting domain-containing protein, partial [Ignavibacteria bacterium]|nr:T9SS type A sorting domain-containing protein [Ignavibacteria bacterium]
GIIDNAFSVGSQFVSRPIYIKFEVDGGGSKYFDSVRIVIGIPKILLVSKAEKLSLMSYYESSLSNSNPYFENLFNQPPKYFYGRDIIIWSSGRNKDSVFTSAELDSLSAFLDRGGKLFLSGQNIAEFLNSFSPSFLQNKLGINYIKNAGIFTSRIYGISTDMFGKDVSTLRMNGGEGAANETSMDIIESRGNFKLSFAYKTDGTDGAGGWIFNPTNNSKIFFMGFGFESINNSESSISRDKLLQKILSWFDPATEVKETNIFSDFHLYQNYPNPFNSISNIKYKIAERCNARMSIYDILGREVLILFDEERTPGTYNLTFDASSLSSGLYFYKLQAGNFTDTKKLMLLK